MEIAGGLHLVNVVRRYASGHRIRLAKAYGEIAGNAIGRRLDRQRRDTVVGCEVDIRVGDRAVVRERELLVVGRARKRR